MPWKVNIYEYERGFGRRLEGTETFQERETADAFVEDYNAGNTAEIVPDCYFKASEPVWEK